MLFHFSFLNSARQCVMREIKSKDERKIQKRIFFVTVCHTECVSISKNNIIIVRILKKLKKKESTHAPTWWRKKFIKKKEIARVKRKWFYLSSFWSLGPVLNKFISYLFKCDLNPNGFGIYWIYIFFLNNILKKRVMTWWQWSVVWVRF